MSQHIVTNEKGKFVFGWDQPLQSFFLQQHDGDLSEEENPVVWLGATTASRMYEVEDLVRAAARNGLTIDYPTQVKLYGEKDDGA
jgi:copper oxidase (laccase) domain-containing protein